MNEKSLISRIGRKNDLPSFLAYTDRARPYYVFDFGEVTESKLLHDKRENDLEDRSRLLRFNLYFVSVTLRGQFKMKINLSEWTMQENDIHFYPPDSISESLGYTDDFKAICIGIIPWFFETIGLPVTSKTMMDLFPRIDDQVVHAEKQQIEVLLFLLRKLRALEENAALYHHHKELTFYYLIMLVYTLIDVRGKQVEQIEPGKFSRMAELRVQFLDWLMKHFREQRSVRFYADKLYVTPKYLSEAIKRLTGKTAGQVIDETVVLEAKIMLSRPGITVKEVSESLNFSDASFFAKFFKRYTGLAPSDYQVSA